MNSFKTWISFSLLILLNIQNSLGLIDQNQRQRCEFERANKMIGYVCSNQNFEEIPVKLFRKSPEILDMSQNRIKDLRRDSFETLLDLKYLYLHENRIRNIETDTFAKLIDLEVLDLSGNTISRIPTEVFSLPNLRNLYVADNSLTKFDNIPSPIIAPLQKLSLAKNGLHSIPKEFGILPNLYFLNISGNPLRDLTPQQFSPFCHLHQVNISKSDLSSCDCEQVMTYLIRKRTIDTFSFYCDYSTSPCRPNPNAYNDTEDYTTCLSIRKQVIDNEQARLTWGIVGLLVVGFLVFFIGCLYCVHRRNVIQMRKKAKINNSSVKPKLSAGHLEPVSEDSSNTSPQKLLIKRSDV